MWFFHFLMLVLQSYILLMQSIWTNAVEVDVDLSVDRTGWIDPNDPLSQPFPHYNYNKNIDQQGMCDCDVLQENLMKENADLLQKLEAVQLVRENTVDVLMKHVLRQFLVKLNVDLSSDKAIFKKAHVQLTPENLSILRRYLNSEKAVEEFGIREDLRAALEYFLYEVDARSENSLLSLIHTLIPYILILNIIFLIPAIFITVRSLYSFTRIIIFILIGAFGVSCYFTYIRKYQEILAQRMMRSVNGKLACSPKGLASEFVDLMLSYVTIKEKSECLKLHEDDLIEPFLMVDPLQIVAEVVSNSILTPFSVAGKHFNTFFKQYFAEVPIHLALLMSIFIPLMPAAIFWVFLKWREHLLRVREQEHQFMLRQQNQRQLNNRENNLDEKERKNRRRALGQSREVTTPTTARSPSASSSQRDTGSTSGNESADESLQEIRRKMEERRKWE